MTLLFIAAVAFAVSFLTLFSGFGLGTLLLPAFAVVFPLDVAVAATAVVHMFNNIFKVGLLYRHAVPKVLLRFGVPAVLAAFVGAAILAGLAGQEPLLVWHLGSREAVVTPISLVMGLMILTFATLDLVPRMKKVRFDPRWLPLGGTLSGFFGGLSGHQGALRAAFLSPLELSPAAFASTQAVLATMVDASRLLIYGLAFFSGRMAGVSTRAQWTLVGVATLSAFGGALLGRRLLPKITVGMVRTITGCLLLLIGAGMATGLMPGARATRSGAAEQDQPTIGTSRAATAATAGHGQEALEPTGSTDVSTSKAEPRNPAAFRILSLGDSYTIGEAVTEAERWPLQLAELLRQRGAEVESPRIIARTGWTTMDLQAAINEAELEPAYDLVTLLIGVNNQYQGRSLEEYRQGFAALLERAITLAGSDASRVLVLSIPDYGVTPFASEMDPAAISAELEQFNAANLEITTRAGVAYVDITPISLRAAEDPSFVAGDGLHPSGAMYQAWAELALPAAMTALRLKK
jgi:uncharacterized membrane protein YfcA/lysophospholipase L1-like esterase